MQIRCIIEPQIAALAAQNATSHDIEILGNLCDELEALIRKRQDFTQKDMDFHTQLATCSQTLLCPILSLLFVRV